MTASACSSLRAILVCGFMVVAGLLTPAAPAAAQDVSSLVTVAKSERTVTDIRTKLVTTTSTITIKNISTTALSIPLQAVFDLSASGVQVLNAVAPGTGNPYGKYYVDLSSSVASGKLQPSGSLTFSVSLVYANTVRFTYNVLLYGTVGKVTPTISWANPADITYGTALGATQLNATATPPGGTFAYNPAPGTVLAAGNSQTLSVTYTPTDLVNYTTATASVSINVIPASLSVTATAKAKSYGQTDPPLTYSTGPFVNGDTSAILTGSLTRVAGETVGNYAIQQGSLKAGANYTIAYTGANLSIGKATTTITWANPADITYGTALGATQLNATANPSGGTFVYNQAPGTVLAAGNGQTLSVAYTPADLINYTTATASVPINVIPASLSVAAAAKAKSYGQTDPPLTYSTGPFVNGDTSAILTGSLIRVAGETVGNYAIQQGSLKAGANYTIAYTGANLSIGKATTTITWANPADITYGMALGTTQLNASANPSGGTFTYNPAPGAVLAAGYGQTLSVTYAPTDLVNYTTATASVPINVLPASLSVTAAAKTKSYGQADPPLTYSTGPFVNGDTSAILTGSLTRVVGETVGSYAIQQGSLSAGANYSIAYTGANLTIGKITPTVTWADPAAIDLGTALSSLQLNASANVPGSFVYTPAAGEVLSAGSHSLNVVFTPADATDYATVSATVSLTVNGVIIGNTAPTANAGPDQTVTMSGGQTTLDVTLDGSKSSDPEDGSAVSFLWTGVPGPSPNNVANPKVTLYPGTYKYTLIVTDSQGAKSAPSLVTITVNQTLNPPVLVVSPSYSYSVDQGNTVSFTASATQVDGNIVSISALPFLNNATFTSIPKPALLAAPATGTFSFTPDSTQSGIQMVTFTARNQLGLTDTKTVQITINKVNHAPVISMASTASVDVGKMISIKASASDPDGDILTLTAAGPQSAPLPSTALFVPATGTITFAPDTTQVGQQTFIVTASDGHLSTSAQVTVTVNSVQPGGTTPVPLILTLDPVASLSLQPALKITGSVNAPDHVVIPPIQSSLIVGMNPATGGQGSQKLTVTLTGQSSGSFPTHFVNGASQASFGSGITVNSLVVASPTSATATITIDSGASLGSRVVNVVTGSETAVSLLGFNVLAGVTTITGRLLDADTLQPVASGANVNIAGSSVSAQTLLDGSFTLFNVPAGVQTLTFNAPDHELITLPVSAPVGTTVKVGDIKTKTTVFNPSAAPTATLGSVFGRGASDFLTGAKTKEDLKKVVIDAILMTGGRMAGVLDEFGNQLNPNITGNGAISLKASGVDLIADRMISGEIMTLGDFLYGFPMLFEWQTQPTLLRALSALQDVVDQAWGNPNDPLSALTIAIFNRGKSTLFDAPRLTPETPLNAIQAYLMASTLFTWANNDIYYMDGSDQPPTDLQLGAREHARTLLAHYQGDIVSDAAAPLLVADGLPTPVAFASADKTYIVLTPGANDNNKFVQVTLDGSLSHTNDGAKITLYQWRPAASTDPRPQDGPDPTVAVKFTSGAHHTYTLYVTDENGHNSAGATVTINITGDCDFTTRDQTGYPWCSTFQKFLGGQALKKADVVASKVSGMLAAIQPTMNGTTQFMNAASSSFANFYKGVDLTKLSNGSLQTAYQEAQALAKSMGQLASFTKGAADIIKGQLDNFVGAVANQMFDYMINKFTDAIIDTSRPAPPFLNDAEVVAGGSNEVGQQVILTFKPSPNEINDFAKFSTPATDPNTGFPIPGTTVLDGIRRYAYVIYRKSSDSGGFERVDIMPGSQLPPRKDKDQQVTAPPSDYTWIDTDPPVGTNTYAIAARVIRTDTVPNTVYVGDQKMVMDYMLGLIPGGGVLNSAFKAVDIADKVFRGLMLQDSDRSDPEHVYVGADDTQIPSLDLAVDNFHGTVYLSIPETSGIFKIGTSGFEEFVNAGFSSMAGLVADSKGNLYCDNKASDDSYGGRIFSFQSGTGARQLVGSTNYYSQMLSYANPTNVLTLNYGVDSQGECIYIADAGDQSIKRLALNTANPPDHNVGQYYAQSSDFFFDPTSKMASDLFGNLFLT